jgi:hypothetical protein
MWILFLGDSITQDLSGSAERVTYLDLRPLFLDGLGRPNPRMGGDHIHITAEGQAAWMEAIAPSLARLLGSTQRLSQHPPTDGMRRPASARGREAPQWYLRGVPKNHP